MGISTPKSFISYLFFCQKLTEKRYVREVDQAVKNKVINPLKNKVTEDKVETVNENLLNIL